MCSCYSCCVFFFFKQKTAYEMRISDWSSDVCSSDLFLVDAYRFAVGNGGDYVFEVVGGVTYIKNAVIQNAAIDADKLSQDVINKEIGRASCRERVCQYV